MKPASPTDTRSCNSVLHDNAQGGQSQPFEKQHSRLLDTLKDVPLHSLTDAQLEYLECLGIAPHVGRDAIDSVEDVLYRNAIDVATAAQKVGDAHDAIVDGVSRSDAVQEALAPCWRGQSSMPEDEVHIRIRFSEGTSIQNVVDLKQWAGRWHGIARGLTMAYDGHPEDIRVVEAGRGSVVLTLAASYLVARGFMLILTEALRVAERYVTVMGQVEVVRGLKLKNAKLAKEMESAAREEREAGVQAIAGKVVKAIGLKANEGDKVPALEKSVDELLKFLGAGGQVDPVLPAGFVKEDEDEDEDGNGLAAELPPQVMELRKLTDEFRILRDHLKQLGPGSGSEADAGASADDD